jgi:NADPH:quinone reductase
MSSSKNYPRTMKAVFLEKPGGPLVVKEIEIPTLKPSEVLIRISAAPVNPSDLARIRNAHHDHDLNTFIPGLEGSGTVVAAGNGILPRLWLGKRVTCSSAYSTSGTWAEYMVTKSAMCFPLSRNISDEQGSMSLVNPLTAIEFFRIIKKNGHKAVINHPAASALGRMIELLGFRNKIPVINIVRNKEQVEMLKGLGSLYILDSSEPSFIDDLRLLTDHLNATILFDSVCSEQLLSMIDVLPEKSEVIIYGNLSGGDHISINPTGLIANNINVTGFFLGNKAKENGLFKNFLNLLQVRKLMSSGMEIKIHAQFPLNNVREAVDTYLQNMSAGKILLIP